MRDMDLMSALSCLMCPVLQEIFCTGIWFVGNGGKLLFMSYTVDMYVYVLVFNDPVKTFDHHYPSDLGPCLSLRVRRRDRLLQATFLQAVEGYPHLHLVMLVVLLP